MGIVEKTHSASNSSVCPVKKSSGDWRGTVDYRNANEAIFKLTSLMADTSTKFSSLLPAHSVFSVIDMSKGFWSVPLHPKGRPWLAFSVDGQQYQWTRTLMGLHNGPLVYHQALRRHLQDLPPMSSVVIQFVDDILLASEDEETHAEDLKSLLDHLHVKGHKASSKNAQLMQSQVIYLGQLVSQGKREMTQSHTAAIQAAKEPTTVKELRSFLVLCNYNRCWVDSFAEIAQP